VHFIDKEAILKQESIKYQLQAILILAFRFLNAIVLNL